MNNNKTEFVRVRVTLRMKDALKEKAKLKGRDFSDYIRRLYQKDIGK